MEGCEEKGRKVETKDCESNQCLLLWCEECDSRRRFGHCPRCVAFRLTGGEEGVMLMA